MFGIDDPQIIIAYAIAFACVLICIAYGFLRWDRDGEG